MTAQIFSRAARALSLHFPPIQRVAALSRSGLRICRISRCRYRPHEGDPHAASPAKVVAGTVFSRRIMDARPDNAAPWRVEIENATGDTVSFDVQFGNRKTIPAGLSLQFLPTGPVTFHSRGSPERSS